MNDPTTVKTVLASVATAAATIALHRLTNKNTSDRTIRSKQKNTYLLAGDVGGTNTRLALYDTTGSKEPHLREYLNSKYTTDDKARTFRFEDEIIEPFLQEWYDANGFNGTAVAIFSCFAVAGPVDDNCAAMTLTLTSKENGAPLMLHNHTKIQDCIL